MEGSQGWYLGPLNPVWRLAVPTKHFGFQHFTVYKGLSLLSLLQAPQVLFCPDSEHTTCDGSLSDLDEIL